MDKFVEQGKTSRLVYCTYCILVIWHSTHYACLLRSTPSPLFVLRKLREVHVSCLVLLACCYLLLPTSRAGSLRTGILYAESAESCRCPSCSQGAPFEELLQGLGTIPAIAGEWGIDRHRVMKGMVSHFRAYQRHAHVRTCPFAFRCIRQPTFLS